MDPTKFGISSIPLHQNVYLAIAPETLTGTNKGKVAVITGAGRGIGQAIATGIAQTGANVAIFDFDTGRLAETKSECESHGVKVAAYGCDVTDIEAFTKVFSQVEEEVGPVDIMVNNAGKFTPRPVSMQSAEELWRYIEFNLKGAIIGSHLALQSMRKRKKGCIINIASRSGTVDAPLAVSYNTGKAGIIRATSSMQEEIELDGLGEKIHLYALHPGGVRTGMGGAPPPSDVLEKYPNILKRDEKLDKRIFRDDPKLCGQTCAFLSTGRAKELRGMYIDCRQDISRLLDAGRDELKKQKLYNLKVDFLDGYENEP